MEAAMKKQPRPDVPGRIVMVLPGGGALGAYQAGAYEALSTSGLEPDWLIGTSIGAINSAVIAGNPKHRRLERLREFWRRVEQNPRSGSWSILAGGVPAFFSPRFASWLSPHTKVGLEQASYYTTEPLRRTLEELVDLDLLAHGGLRLTVGAVGVSSGRMKYFDSRHIRLGLEHVMASGALPPAFPAVRIEGEAYWDGGIYSNTPVEPVFEDLPRQNSVVFAVNVWQRRATEPQSIWEVMSRHKDIQFATRAEPYLARQKQIYRMRRIVQTLVKQSPQPMQHLPGWRELAAEATDTTMQVVRLFAPPIAGEDMLKDIDFSRSGIRTRWTAGYEDTMRVLERAPWKEPVDASEGVVIHEAHSMADVEAREVAMLRAEAIMRSASSGSATSATTESTF